MNITHDNESKYVEQMVLEDKAKLFDRMVEARRLSNGDNILLGQLVEAIMKDAERYGFTQTQKKS